MRIAVIGPAPDFAAAVTCTGEEVTAPDTGVQTVTPVTAAVHCEGVGVEVGVGVGVGVGLGVGVGVGLGPVLTVMLNGVLNDAPLEPHACTTTLCAPMLTGRLTSRLEAFTR